jgi:hypothetical protein
LHFFQTAPQLISFPQNKRKISAQSNSPSSSKNANTNSQAKKTKMQRMPGNEFGSYATPEDNRQEKNKQTNKTSTNSRTQHTSEHLTYFQNNASDLQKNALKGVAKSKE